jgi:ComF family protein
MRIGLKKFFLWLRDGLFPIHCVQCGREGAVLCSTCLSAWDSPKLRKDGDRMASFAYADPVARGLLCAWKYEGSTEARDALFARCQPSWSGVQEWLRVEGAEAIVPLPLHKWKKWMRGFDQAEEIAIAVGAGLVSAQYLLIRTKFTDPQAKKKEGDREHSMEGNIFRVIGKPPKVVCLVDDVWTTGATSQAAARALKAAGAEKVLFYTICEG